MESYLKPMQCGWKCDMMQKQWTSVRWSLKTAQNFTIWCSKAVMQANMFTHSCSWHITHNSQHMLVTQVTREGWMGKTGIWCMRIYTPILKHTHITFSSKRKTILPLATAQLLPRNTVPSKISQSQNTCRTHCFNLIHEIPRAGSHWMETSRVATDYREWEGIITV